MDAFRVAFAGSLLLYLHAWWQEPYEWLTHGGFHISAASSPYVAAPLLPAAALPLFGALMFGAVGALLFGWRLPLSTWVVLAFVVYVTFADIAAAFTMNKIFIAGLAVLAVAPAGAYFRIGARLSPPGQSVWPIRILQATLLVQYGTAGWCKVLHGTWLDDPLTLFSQAQGFYRTDLCSWMLRRLPLGAWTLMQYSALAFELLSPALFAVRRLRPVAFLWGGTFQIGTALMMKDLIYFSLQMMSFYLLFVDDAWLHAMRLRARRALPRFLVFACVATTSLVPIRALAQNAPELPRVFVDTTYSPPTRGTLIPVRAGGDLQAALEASRPGDVIELQAGATFTGNFILPWKPGTDWIYIRSSAHALLPRPGTRVSPSHAALMPRIDTPNRAPAIRTAAAAHHYRLVGIEVTARGETRSTGPYSDNNVVYLESEGGQTSLSQVPTDIIVDRCYIHGTPTGGVRRGIAMNGARMAVIDSYLEDFHEVGADSQAISGWNGPGPFKIVNNHLEGAGENLMFGGADPSIPDLVPSDIEIRGNHLWKPLSWRIGHPTYAGRPWSVKNIFELKNARRVLAEGNLLEHNWQHDQNGFAILFTVRNQDGGAPWCTVEDVTFRKNILRHSGGGFNILAADNNFPSQQTRRILIQDNLLDDISSVNWGGTGRLFQLLSLDSRNTGIQDLTVEHNTGFSNAWTAYTGDRPIAVHRSFTFRNNITPKRTYGFAGGTRSWPPPSPLVTGDGRETLNTFYLAPVFAGNVLIGSTPADYSGYPGNFFPATDAEVGFVDLSRGNYRLGPASPYKNADTGGKDPGAAIDALEAATAGALSGKW